LTPTSRENYFTGDFPGAHKSALSRSSEIEFRAVARQIEQLDLFLEFFDPRLDRLAVMHA
jgi:hypothetical protein